MNAAEQLENEHPNEPRNEIVPRATVEAIVQQRDLALGLYSTAFSALTIAAESKTKANAAARAINPREGRFNHHLHSEKVEFMGVAHQQPRDEYMAVAKKIVDTEAWARIIEITELERLMDKQAKGELYDQLLKEPPEATVDNIFATLQQFAADAGTIFRRGIANCFSKLDRRFRSHDGFKIGSRVILDRMFDQYGFSNYHRDMQATLLDIERTFMVLDGSAVPPGYAGICGKLDKNRYTGNGARQGEVEDEFFLVRVFKNGNCHVWFKRDDLLERVNKLLAEYYGEVVPDGQTPEDDGGLFTPKTSVAKNFAFYPTPESTADYFLDGLPLYREEGAVPITVLEPSAGTGNLARRIKDQKPHPIVDCIEIQPKLAAALRQSIGFRNVWCADFLTVKPDPKNLYDRVVMNPPFDRERDIDHVIHALEFLKPDGYLTAIMSAGTEFRETRKAVAFRALMQKMNARFNDLPSGSFSSVGTNINTIRLRVWKNGRSFW